MVLAERQVARVLKGKAKPRIAPPTPVRSDVASLRETAAGMDIELMPWQEYAGRFLTATGPDGLLLYREVCIVVARQQGKTTLMKPLIVRALRDGKRIMHIAQNRELPRQMFNVIADAMSEEPDLFPKRRGKTIWPRYGAGQEEIILVNGGVYRIAAAGRGGARGVSNDIVIIDELREMYTDEVIKAAEPTLLMSPDPQAIYLSNAGEDDSIVLNAVRDRAGKDESLAYLEWSASPERAADDHQGWAEANPALGHYPSVLRSLEASYRRHKLAGTMATFETEHLCRWVKTTRQMFVEPIAWNACETDTLTPAKKVYMAVSMDPDATRASAVVSWQQPDGTVALRSILEARGEPIDVPRLGADLRDEALRWRVREVAFDPMTDAELAKYFKVAEPVNGQKFANASAQFVNLIAAKRLRWTDSPLVGDDLGWTARKENDETGSFQAVRANDDRPITAALASIRAVWLASGPRPPVARIY